MTIAGSGGLDVVLLHGVGLTPRTFDPLMATLQNMYTGTGVTTRAPLRRRYRGGQTPPTFASVGDEAADLLAELAERGAPDQPCLVVGVSGGATLAVAIAAAEHPNVIGVVAHEPLIGPLASDLHGTVTASAALLASGDGDAPTRAREFVRRLVGIETWTELPAAIREFPGAHAEAVIAEVPCFASFAPDAADLRRAAPRLTVTTGRASHARRHHAADVLAGLGATTEVVDGAAHLVPWEAPDAFAGVVARAIARAA